MSGVITMVGSHPVVRDTAGLGDGRGGAGSLGGRVPGTGGRTNDSARPSSGADPPGQLRRSRSPPSRGSPNHRLAAGVNCDASLFCSVPDSGLVVRGCGGVLWSCCGSAVRHTSASGGGPAGRSLRRNRFGRGRSIEDHRVHAHVFCHQGVIVFDKPPTFADVVSW